ncbi:hypothetical protein ACFW6C_07600 [Streptomyces fungicidicus]|uniref:hypothetical protein n=1 Tax=Streptomyces fungicidicus TaxID=68203 RepID=UPI0036C62224
MARVTYKNDAVAGFERLAEREPTRLEKLYRSLDAGRLDDVVHALYAYWTAKPSVGERCTNCGKGDLPQGLMCDREAATKGTCLRCCPHNHG